MNRTTSTFLLCALLSLLMTACLAQSENGREEEPMAETMDKEARLATRIEAAKQGSKQLPERAPPVDQTPVVESVPAKILQDVKADVVGRTGAAPEDIEILRAQDTTWNDGSMGCPKPGEFYTQALVEGYWIVLRHAGQDHDYRVARRGWFIRCEHPAGGAPSNPPAM